MAPSISSLGKKLYQEVGFVLISCIRCKSGLPNRSRSTCGDLLNEESWLSISCKGFWPININFLVILEVVCISAFNFKKMGNYWASSLRRRLSLIVFIVCRLYYDLFRNQGSICHSSLGDGALSAEMTTRSAFFFCRSFFLLRSFVKIVSIVYPDQISISYGECFVCWCMTGLIDGHFQVVITQFNVYNVHRRCIDNGPCIIKEMVPLFVPYERWLFKLASEPVPMFITLDGCWEIFFYNGNNSFNFIIQ